MSRLRLATLALPVLVAGCGRDATQQVLHVRVTLAGDERSDSTRASEHHDGVREAISNHWTLSLDVPVTASRAGEPFRLAPDPTQPSTFSGDVRLLDDSHWHNVDSSRSIRVDMANRWPSWPPAAASSATMLATVAPAAGGGLGLRIDADVPLTGTASVSGFAYASTFESVPASAWKECELAARTAHCTLALRFTTAAPLPQPEVQPIDGSEHSRASWNREVRGMRVTWDRDGHFVARADGLPGDAGADPMHTVRLLAWTSAPGDSPAPPASAPRTPTIAP